MESNTHKLFSEFSGISKKAWIEKIRSDLKDPQAMERLVWRTEEGIDVDPFYRPEDIESLDYLEKLWSRRNPATAPNGWIICQEMSPGDDPDHAAAQMMEALKGGAQAIRIRFSGTVEYGLEELKVLLSSLPLAQTEIYFRGGMRIDMLFEHLCEIGRQHGLQPDHFKGGLGADPLGYMVRSGYPVASLENLSSLIQKVQSASPALKTMDVDGGQFQNAGSTLVQELAFTLAMASEYMAMLTDRGLDPLAIQSSMRVSLTTGPNYFMEIAKLRAARILWSNLMEAYGIIPSEAKITLHSTTSSWNQTLYDPYVNMLRGTSEGMAAVLGGADYLTVLPFDHARGKSTPFSDRIARNVPIILREEAYLDKVADPASGSYYLEKLTHELGEKAWELFREVEAKGGFRQSFESGWIQEQVRNSATVKQQQVLHGKKKIIGTNAYPNPGETNNVPDQSFQEQPSEESPLERVSSFRPSSQLEETRMKMEQMQPRPRAFLMKFGTPNWAITRAAFASNFFTIGGYEMIDSSEIYSIKDGVDVALEINPEVVVLCSSDEEYTGIPTEALKLLRQKSLIVVAGDPTNIGEPLQKLGIKHYIHRRSLLMETLQVINSIVLK